jgi:hypothetical protein
VVTNASMSAWADAATSSTARSKAARLALDGLLKPLSFLTNWSEAARISSSVAGGAKLKRVLIFLHTAVTSIGSWSASCSAAGVVTQHPDGRQPLASEAWNRSRINRKQTQWRPVRRCVAVVTLGVSDEEKAPAQCGFHVATSVEWLCISICAHEGRNGKRTADTSACETL